MTLWRSIKLAIFIVVHREAVCGVLINMVVDFRISAAELRENAPGAAQKTAAWSIDMAGWLNEGLNMLDTQSVSWRSRRPVR